MPHFLHRFFILFLIAGCAHHGNAQDGFYQLRFTATEASGKVFLDWTMDLGLTCNGIEITRSTDGINFTEVGFIAGVCGSTLDTVRYSFTDPSPVPNQINYYRLVLGTIGITQVVSLEIIDLEGTGYQVRPNPISTEGMVYFSNDSREPYRLILFSTRGSEERVYTTRDEFFRLNVSDMAAGLYVFRIESETGAPRSIGKILVTR